LRTGRPHLPGRAGHAGKPGRPRRPGGANMSRGSLRPDRAGDSGLTLRPWRTRRASLALGSSRAHVPLWPWRSGWTDLAFRSSRADIALGPGRPDRAHQSRLPLGPSDPDIAFGPRRSRRSPRADRARAPDFALWANGSRRPGRPNLARIALCSLGSGRALGPRFAFRPLQPRGSGAADIPLRPRRPVGTCRPHRSRRPSCSSFAFRPWRSVSSHIAFRALRSDGADRARFALRPGWARRTLLSLLPGLTLIAPIALGASRNREQRRNGGRGDSQAHTSSPPVRRFPMLPPSCDRPGRPSALARLHDRPSLGAWLDPVDALVAEVYDAAPTPSARLNHRAERDAPDRRRDPCMSYVPCRPRGDGRAPSRSSGGSPRRGAPGRGQEAAR
jgi:hypothetical protein